MAHPDAPDAPAPGLSAFRVLVAAAALVVCIAGLKSVAPILSVFLFALILAMSLSPLALLFLRWGAPQSLAVTLTVLAFVVVFVGIVGVLGVSLAELGQRMPDYAARLAALRDDLFARLAAAGMDTAGLERLDVLNPSRLVGPAASLLGAVASGLGSGIFLILLTVLFLVELVALQQRPAPAAGPGAFARRFQAIGEDVRLYVGITGVTGAICAVAHFGVMAALGVPFALTWGVLTFLLNFVPAIGGLLSLAPPTLLALLELGWPQAAGVVVSFVVINFLTDNILKPRLMAKSVEISLVGIFFALVFWGWVLGPVGAFASVPIAITLKKLYREFEGSARQALGG